MSVRREVISLSQLLRRNENSRSRRGTEHAPPLQLQTSRRKAKAPSAARHKTVETRKAQSTSLIENQTFTQRVLDASCVLTPQPEIRASIQKSNEYPVLSQESNTIARNHSQAALSQDKVMLPDLTVYEADSDQLSAITSMSQSSFPQTQSQNLLGSSQDDQLYRFQQWQAEQAQPTHTFPTRCNGADQLKELESKLMETFAVQTREQKRQQHELLTQFASPINQTIAEVKAKLAMGHESQQQQVEAIGKLEKSISSMAEFIRQQGFGSNAACEETRIAVMNDTATVKAALSELHAKVETVKGGLKSCSGLVTQVIEAESKKHEALLSAFTDSSCICRCSVANTASRKRRRSPYRQIMAEGGSNFHAIALPAHTGARSYDFGDITEIGKMDDEGLDIALRRIERLRAKRRQYQ